MVSAFEDQLDHWADSSRTVGCAQSVEWALGPESVVGDTHTVAF